jgi:glutaryl-CoA dehydrogenase
MYKPLLRSTARRLAIARPAPTATRAFAAHATPQPFDWQDPLGAKHLLTEEEIDIAEMAEKYCQERMAPRVLRESADFN